MRGTYERQVADAREIERQIRQGNDKIVVRNFGKVARLLWPFKTSEHIAAIADADKRTADRWLAGEHDPPVSVVIATMNEIFRR